MSCEDDGEQEQEETSTSHPQGLESRKRKEMPSCPPCLSIEEKHFPSSPSSPLSLFDGAEVSEETTRQQPIFPEYKRNEFPTVSSEESTRQQPILQSPSGQSVLSSSPLSLFDDAETSERKTVQRKLINST